MQQIPMRNGGFFCGDNFICALRLLNSQCTMNDGRAIGSTHWARNQMESTLNYYFVLQFHINNDEKSLIQLLSGESVHPAAATTSHSSAVVGG